MTDTLGLALYALPIALALTAIALVCNIVVVSSRAGATRARSAAPSRATPTTTGTTLVIEGDGGADAVASSPRGGRLASYATAFTTVALVLLTAYLGVRMATSGHGPFANQHEFAVSFVWGILAAYLVAEWRWQVRALSVAVLPVAACLLLYAMQMDSDVESLVPALQNNTLLTLHVGFAIVSYGAACVSFGAAVLYLLSPRLHWRAMPRPETLDEIGYKAAVVTFPLLTAMIVLGAIWADTAWGRYWGWDPKETAALVTWLMYAAFLHARVVFGWRGRRAAWLLVAGFAAVLFAYFGNHFFGGLHSYG